MTITALHRRRGQLYMLELDNEPAMTVDVRTLEESPYRVGSELDDESLYALLQLSLYRRAREKALWYLSGRDYAAEELVRKLEKECDRGMAEEIVAGLKEQGFIREEAFARRLAEELCCRRHYPWRRAVQELIRRGVNRDLAQAAVNEISSDDLQEALALLEKKRYTDTDRQVLYRKVTAFLARQGYEYATIRRAWEQWSMVQLGDGGIDDEW